MRELNLYTPARGRRVAVVTLFFLLMSGLPSAAQTDPEPGGPPEPAWLADETVCGWDDVEGDPRLARVCLQKAGVNAGLAEYAFAEIPFDYDPDEPTFSGTPEEAGLVSRWAMGEAIHRMITVAVEAAGGTLPVLPEGRKPFFVDVGWLSEDTRRKLEELFEWGVTTGTDRYGDYSPTLTVTRQQMAMFFARSLAAIDRFTDGAGTPGFTADATYRTLRENTDAYDIPAPFADLQAGERPPKTLSRQILGSVSIIYDLGITRGTGFNRDGRLVYYPRSPVDGGQMAMFVVRLLAHTNVRVDGEQPDLSDIALPVVQQGDTAIHLGTRTRDGYNIEDPDRGACRHNERLPSPVAVRPPREIDIYRYVPFKSGLWEYGEPLFVSEPVSLQVGDWYWNDPPYSDYEHRYRYVLVEFRTAVGYTQALPYTAAFFCVIPEGEPGPESDVVSTSYEWYLEHVLPSAAGVFYFVPRHADAGFYREAGNCDLGDYDIPVPSDGYTERYPCAGIWPDRVRAAWGSDWDYLRPCKT